MNVNRIIIIMLFCIGTAQSQNAVPDISLSNKPTESEIGTLFYRVSAGELDIFNVLPAVVAKKDKAIPALEALLFSPQDTIKKEYVLLALDGISGKKAVNLIIRSAQSETDVEVRGKALSLLGRSQYGRAKEDTLVPNKEILNVLYAEMEDTAMSENAGMRLSDIARDGIRNWTARDPGEMPKNDPQISQGGNKPDMAARHENYWQKIAAKLQWDKDEKVFKVKGK